MYDAGDPFDILLNPYDPSAPVDRDYLQHALLRVQYFPFVKTVGDELPPLFSSDTFTADVARRLGTGRARQWVEYRARRFDGHSRRLGIPHPEPYAALVLHMGECWDEIAKLLVSESSLIAPRRHSDGRLIQMNYDGAADSHARLTRMAFGKEFIVSADISNCFPSIYTHSLDWAARGKVAAKEGRFDKHWGATLDKRAMATTDGETRGLLIGPAVSNVLAELVLQAVDKKLARYDFIRAIDDYTVFCESRDVAERFVVDLQSALAEFRLDVNRRKTIIRSLRDGLSDAWVAELRSFQPPTDASDLSVAQFIQHAEHLARVHPNRSVMKWAVKSALSMKTDPSDLIVKELVRVSHFHPQLLPQLSAAMSLHNHGSAQPWASDVGDALRAQLERAIMRDETDSVLWLLYLLCDQLEVALDSAQLEAAMALENDLVWLALLKFGAVDGADLASRVLSVVYADRADYDAHWLVRYELFRRGLLSQEPAGEEQWMDVLSAGSVTFLR